MYERVGAGVTTGALTTSIVFFCLVSLVLKHLPKWALQWDWEL
jgi:hypothetical protein